MNKLYRCLSLTAAFVLMLTSVALAQERVVTGTVTDENGSQMPGVNVLLKGTSVGTASDTDGKFSITVPNDQATVVLTFVGYASAEVVIGSRTTINIQMTPDVTTLTELVVTGYAVQEKKDVTGSVSIVKPAELISIPSGNATAQLQGRVAGVTVTGDGRPGEQAKVRIRGFGSFRNNDPLYVVDGVPTQDISTINPGDIESLTVLKDAGAASIYGSRASNGVIVITTKSGVSSGVKVNYNMYVGSQDPGKGPDNLLNTQGYADLQWLVYDNDGTVETHPVYGPSTNAAPTLPPWADDTNWYEATTRSAQIMNHDLSLSGGNQNAKFYGGLNYFSQDGIVITNYSKRFSARFNSEFKVKDRLTFGENVTISHRSGVGVSGNGQEGSPISKVYQNQPIVPVRITQPITGISHNFVAGEYGGTGIAPRLGNTSNVIADLERGADNKSFDVKILGSAFADVRIINGLNFKTTFGGTFQNGYYSNYNFATYERAENNATPSLNEGAYYNNDWVWTNTVTFNKTFDSHKLLVVGGYEALKLGIGRGLNATRAGYFSDAVSFRTLDNGAAIQGASSYFNTPRTMASTFLRADYGFMDKYMLSATVRRDGSSVFGKDNLYGTFPSVTLAWRVSEESFLSGNEFISDLKIRGGYGTMGNQQAVNPANQFFLFGGSTSESNYDLNGSGNSSVQGFRPTRIGNPKAKWETNVTTNIGFDAGLMDNKLQITFDYYTKQTEELLYDKPLPAAPFGGGSQPFINIAKMQNTGIDLQIIYKQNFSNDLSFEGIVSMTTYKNEITAIAPPIDYFSEIDYNTRIGAFNRNAVGHSVSEFFGYQVQGLWQSDAEVTAANALDGNATSIFQDGAEPGFFRYADLNGDNQITADDRTYIGNPNPNFTYGLNLAVRYKNFDVTAFLYGSQGAEIFNYNKWWVDFWQSFQGQKSTDLLRNSWTPENPGAETPKASNKSNFSTNNVSNSYYVENGSFMRMKNLQIGFNFPTNTISKIGMTNARIYVQGVNLFTASKYSGMDPDISSTTSTGNMVGNDVSFGVDQGNYPLVKQYIIGVNIGF